LLMAKDGMSRPGQEIDLGMAPMSVACAWEGATMSVRGVPIQERHQLAAAGIAVVEAVDIAVVVAVAEVEDNNSGTLLHSWVHHWYNRKLEQHWWMRLLTWAARVAVGCLRASVD
jgi:hypothetical protein